MKNSSSQRGFALFFGLVFLLMMTLVAVTAMRGTALELNMANNVANFEIAFERAESGRVAFSRITADLARCEWEKWPNTVQLIGGGGGACAAGCAPGGQGGWNANFDTDPGMEIDSPNNSYVRFGSENVNDPSTVDYEYQFKGSDGNFSEVSVIYLGSFDPGGGDASALSGYSSGAQRSSAQTFEFFSRAEIGGSIAQSAAHYHLPFRETQGECTSDLAYTP